MTDEITVNGKPLSEHLKEIEDKQKKDKAQEQFNKDTTIPTYNKPTKQYDQTKVRSKPGRFLSKEEILQEKGLMSMGPVPRAHKLIWIITKEMKAEGLSASEIYKKAGFEKNQLTQISSVLSNVYKKLGEEGAGILTRKKEAMQYRYFLTEKAVGISYENALKLFDQRKYKLENSFEKNSPAAQETKAEQISATLEQTESSTQDHNINVNINFKVNLSFGFSKQ